MHPATAKLTSDEIVNVTWLRATEWVNWPVFNTYCRNPPCSLTNMRLTRTQGGESMHATHRRPILVFVSLLLATALPAVAQHVIATIPIGGPANSIANGVLNSATNRVYIISGTTLDVIDGAANTVIATVQLGSAPQGMLPNKVTNRIYITDPTDATVTVVNGVTNSIDTVIHLAGDRPRPLAVDINPVTNKIYVTESRLASVVVIDGLTNQVTATIAVGNHPSAIRVNPITNKIFVTNKLDGTVSVIDGATNTVAATLTVGQAPGLVLVNAVTNKAYVNDYGDDMGNNTALSVIDGVTLIVTTIPIAGVVALDVDQVSNKISETTPNNTVTIVDGDTLTTTVLTVGNSPRDVESNAVTNKLYVMNAGDNTVSVIDFANNSQIAPIPVGMGPYFGIVNPVTNRIYVVNETDSSISVIGDGNSDPVQFVPITPCRLVDTRITGGPIPGGTSRTFNLLQLAQSQGCASLSSAAAYSLNVTVVPHGYLGYLTMWPTGEDQPLVSTLNSLDGRIKANAAILPAGYHGAVSIYVTNTTDVVLDIDGYFAPVSSSTLAFYPLSPPCRVADTRNSTFPQGLGPPHLSGGAARDFPVLSSTCGIPGTAQGYSLNFTAVPYPGLGNPLGYLEVWPKDQKPQNPVSTLNNLTGTIVANAALVPAGTGGEITVYPSNDTNLVIDVNGYFAPAGQPNALSLYPAAPCRVIDTRKVGSGQPFTGTLSPPVDVVDSQCAPPSAAQAYVFNATVVPSGGLGYLTLWPDPLDRPTVSTLNALDGWITNNMAIVLNIDGKTDAYASGTTQLILDISSYFAP